MSINKVDLLELRERSKYILERNHPVLPLLIWNYSRSCQYDGAWDEFTSMTRGLITDLDGNVVERPFEKFFNIDETEETKMKNLPSEVPIITEKLDGSLGIQYYNGDIVCITTRGSFTSPQALWATNWMNEHGYKKTDFKENYTYLYEIIYSENRIVISYEKDELVLLAVKNIVTGEELDFKEEGRRLGLRVPRTINTNIATLIEEIRQLPSNEEGVVLKYSNGLRVKMKGREYLRLHKLLTQLSIVGIWEMLRDGKPLDELLERVPDEFYDWVRDSEKSLLKTHKLLKQEAVEVWEKVKDLKTRREQAEVMYQSYSSVSHLVFLLLDEKEIDGAVWKMIKPKSEKPLRKDIDVA